MDETLESITGMVAHDRVETFLRGAAAVFGDLWDIEQIVSEVLPMAAHHIAPGDHVHLLVEAYPEQKLLVRLDDDRSATTLQEWEYLPTALWQR